ncbi:hypothetical protein CREGCYN_14140 [Synechococcus sp. M16CYN]
MVRRGTYDGTLFHRVIRDPAPFVVQGGDPQSSDHSVPLDQLGTGNFIDPTTGQVRTIPLEISFRGEEKPRYSHIVTNPSELNNLTLNHKRGSVAMARSQLPNSASAQFYIALKSLPELDGRYAVFGWIVDGMDVVDEIRRGDQIVKANLRS